MLWYDEDAMTPESTGGAESETSVSADAVWPPPPTGVEEPTSSPFDPAVLFPGTNMWLVVLLSLLIGNIYVYYWLFRANRAIRRIRPEHGLPVVAVVICSAIQVAWIGSLVSSNHFLTDFAPLLRILSWLGLIIWTFSLRLGINAVFETHPNGPGWANKVWTFFLGNMYLQYKINENLKRLPPV